MNLLKISSLRRRTIIILACAVVGLAGFIGSALLLPRFIDLDTLKAQMSVKVNARLEGSLQTDRLEWSWLPLPHLTLRNTRFASEKTAFVVPLAKVYPDWWPLLRGQVRIGKVLLESPEIMVNGLSAALSEPPDPELAGLTVVIRNGTLQVAPNSQWPLLPQTFSMKALNGRVTAGLAAIDFDLAGVPVEGGHLAVSGTLREDESYRVKFACRNFNLHKVIPSFAQGKLALTDAPFNFTGSLEGRGPEKITGKIVGDSLCLLAFPKDKKIVLNCGVVDLAFAKDGDDLLLTLNELELHEPGLKIAGTVRRFGADKANSAPVWQIDLKGENLELSKIRAALLSVWGEKEIVKEIGEIVQDGTVGKASYAFKGTAADFEFVRKMQVTAEDIDATIKIPEVDMVLTNIRGKMRIEGGILTVDADQAQMGNSRGKNGRLILGLPDDDFLFKLDVDLDADLAELPEVLDRLVEHQPFLNELAKFSAVSGRARGHLHLGDHLKNFQVNLAVAAMQGKGRYAPLSSDFVIESGELTIAPTSLQWRNVRGAYGSHVVKKTAGQVRWPDEVFFACQLDAVLVAKELAKEDLSKFKEISGVLHENITQADGRIELRNTTISGKVSEPKLWKTDADVIFQNLSVKTPFFPEPILVKQGKGHLSQKEITVSNTTGSIFGDSFTLDASLTHKAFAEPRGKISLQGRVGQSFGQWLKNKDVISPDLFPRLPFQLESLQIDLQEEKTYVRGMVKPDGVIFNPPKVNFSLELAKDDSLTPLNGISEPTKLSSAKKTQNINSNLLKMTAHVYGGKEEATVSLDFLDKTREVFLFSWKGELSKETVDQLLEQKGLLQGKIAGDFQLYLPSDPSKAAFAGHLEATDLRWLMDRETERFLDIQELQLVGKGKDLQVKRLACALNDKESVVVNGLISRVANGFFLKLDLASKALSKETLLDFQETLKRLGDKDRKSSASGAPRQTSWVTGTVAFVVDKFTAAHKTGEGASSTLVWQPLKGEIKIHPQWQWSTVISNGRLCCLDTTGTWFSNPEMGRNNFVVSSSACATTSPRFETVLPCLGYPQDIIEGGFSLAGFLDGTLDHWQDGQLQIESHQGRILRMKLLAKIFSVINITDLFSVGQGEDGVGASTKGFPYSDLILKAHVKENELIIDEAVVRGEGLDLFARGKMNLNTFDMDVVVMISPFKTIDAIISKVPLLGKIIGGETATLVTFPVGVTGKASDPQVNLLPPGAVGDGLLNIIKRTLLMPFYILSPILPEEGKKSEK